MTVRRIRFRKLWMWIPVAAFLLASCDSVEPDEPPTLTVRFIQSDVSGGEVIDMRELAVFEVQVNQHLQRDSAFSQSFSLSEDDPFQPSLGISYSGLQSHLREDILFWFVEKNGSGEIVTSGVSDPFGRLPEGRTALAAKHGQAQVLDGTMYAFSVEGIGSASTAPLKLSFGGSGEGRSFEYDPERHRLPADHVLLHVDEDAIGSFLPLDEASGFTIEVTADGFNLDDRTFLFAISKPVPTFGLVNGNPVEGSTVTWHGRALSDQMLITEASDVGGRMTYILESVPEELDFYLVAAGEE